MGDVVGWHCGDCGAGEEFYLGGSMGSINEPEVVDLARSGAYGSLVRRLIGDGIPAGITVFRMNEYFVCPECGEMLPGGALRITGEDGVPVYSYAPPGPCPRCGSTLDFYDNQMPLREGEIVARCRKPVVEGCPDCGGRHVRQSGSFWA